jgi:excinuclease ABC subunit A
MKTFSKSDCIQLRGVRVHNLKNVDVDIPLNQLTVITGVSGSGKSSLAFDTLFVEGQRRYVDSFSASARQHLDRLEKPDVDEISRIPPAVAIRQNSSPPSERATIATSTEIQHYLEMLFVRQGRLFCPDCDVLVEQHTSASIVEFINLMSVGTRCQLAFRLDTNTDSFADDCQELIERGFSRAVVGDLDASCASTTISDLMSDQSLRSAHDQQRTVFIIVDRISVGKTEDSRLIESIEACLKSRAAHCIVLSESAAESESTDRIEIDQTDWSMETLAASLTCSKCARTFRQPHNRDLNFMSSAGMCTACQGAGSITVLNLDQLIPDRSKTIADGALAVFADEKWAKDKERVISFARDQGIPLDIPIEKLTAGDWELLVDGDRSAKNRQGIQAFLDRLERRVQTHEIAVFLAQWRTIRICDECNGTRLNEVARAVRLEIPSVSPTDNSKAAEETSLPGFTEQTIDRALVAIQTMQANWPNSHLVSTRHLLSELENRLQRLREVGLGYLGLGRTLRSLSSGEARRIELASVLGSPLVHSLFVLDEPSAGLHVSDMEPVISALHRLRDVGNTVVVVEHDRRFINAADYCIDIGPRAGQAGGEVVYSGKVAGVASCESSLTAEYISRSTSDVAQNNNASRINEKTKWIELRDAKFHNLNVVEARLPLDCLCVVAGVSGSGKSSLVEHVLYPAVCELLSRPSAVLERGTWSSLSSLEHIDDVQFVDDSPLARNVRSNPATWLDVFPAIRTLFAETQDAVEKGFTPGHFSFNSDRGGRCEKCDGAGRLEVDMQFLADVVMTCPECAGARYRNEILEVTWRTRSIADVLQMTSSEAFAFFRGQPKIQRRLQSLKEVGLDYLTLGQPLSTLSGGEAQRLKLAGCLSATKKRSLILMSEPTKGLHPADVEHLIGCFDRLIAVGHSLVIIEHDEDVIRAADHVITMGPGAGPFGGRITKA